jgi:hypothetical protein
LPLRGSLLALVATGSILSACADQSVVRGREDMLASAGFKIQPANTPARKASMRALPADRFVRQTRDGRTVYLFADPLVCNCLYMGDQAAFGRYHQAIHQREVASEKLLEEQMNASMTWDWGPWDPW